MRLILLLFITGAWACNAQPSDVSLNAPVPASPLAFAGTIGNPGITTYAYYVIANYGGGTTVSQPAVVRNVPNTLSGSSYVSIGWNRLSGVVTYDVVRVTPPVQFTGSCTCAVATGLTSTNVSDTGSSLTSYTIGTPAIAVNATIYANNRDYIPPELRQIVNGVDTPLGSDAAIPYPGAGVANSTGVAWGTSYQVSTVGGASKLVETNTSNQEILTGSTATDQPTLGAELVTVSTTWTAGANWSGSYLGWVHANGSTATLVSTNIIPNIGCASVPNISSVIPTCLYKVGWTVTGYVSGSFTVSFGGIAGGSGATTSGSYTPWTTSASGLVVTPTSDFVGTIVLSVKNLTFQALPIIELRSSDGTVRSELRAGNNARNVFLGGGAGYVTTTAADNTGVGSLTLGSLTSGFFDSCMGVDACANMTTDGNNIGIGVNALHLLQGSLGQDVAVGTGAMGNSIQPYQTTAIGHGAGASLEGPGSTAVGAFSLFSASGVTGLNTCVGAFGGYSITTALSNVCIGDGALYSSNTNSGNTAGGSESLYYITNAAAIGNSAWGYHAGKFLANGSTPNAVSQYSTFIGANAFPLGNSENNEIVIGANAVGHGTGTTTVGSTATTDTYIAAGRFRVPGTVINGTNTVTFSATPNFDFSLGNTQIITLTGSVTGWTVSNIPSGGHVEFVICQDMTGSRTFANGPASVHGFMTIGSELSKCSAQTFAVNGSAVYATSLGVINE